MTSRRPFAPRPARPLADGVNATPTMNLNGQVIVGLKSVPELSALIDAAAAAAGG